MKRRLRIHFMARSEVFADNLLLLVEFDVNQTFVATPLVFGGTGTTFALRFSSAITLPVFGWARRMFTLRAAEQPFNFGQAHTVPDALIASQGDAILVTGEPKGEERD